MQVWYTEMFVGSSSLLIPSIPTIMFEHNKQQTRPNTDQARAVFENISIGRVMCLLKAIYLSVQEFHRIYTIPLMHWTWWSVNDLWTLRDLNKTFVQLMYLANTYLVNTLHHHNMYSSLIVCILNPNSAGIAFSRQNLTYVDVNGHADSND